MSADLEIDAMTQVVQMVSHCGDSTNLDVQLTVIKTLLTVTTAEHFRVHGDCLVQVCYLSMPFIFEPGQLLNLSAPRPNTTGAYGSKMGPRNDWFEGTFSSLL